MRKPNHSPLLPFLPPSSSMTDTPISNTSTLWHDRDIQDRVAVVQAENDFSRAQQSLETQKVSGDATFRDSSPVDLEKGHDGDRQETFDLREYLTSSNDANSAAGIKHKHVGVTWEDLEVSGIGGGDNKVRHLVESFLRSLSYHPRSPDVRVHVRRLVFPAPFSSFIPQILGQMQSLDWLPSLSSSSTTRSNQFSRRN